MSRSPKHWLEHALAIGTFVVLAVTARLLRLEQWLPAALNAFLAIWGARVGTALWRSSGHVTDLYAGILFSAGAACLAALYGLALTEPIETALAASAGVLMSGALIVAIIGRRRSKRGTLGNAEAGADHFTPS